MIEATQNHTPDETTPGIDREQVVIMEPADNPIGNNNGVAPSPLETALAWQVGQGYGNQVGEYYVQPMTLEPMAEIATSGSTLEGDFSPHEDLSYAVNPMTVETMSALESNEAPAENVFVINSDRLATMSEAERKVYLREKVVAIYDAQARMSRQWEEYKLQHKDEPTLVAEIDKSQALQVVIDNERADMLAKVPPEESIGPQTKRALRTSDVWDSLYKVGAKFAPQIVVSAALIAGAAGTATEAHGNPLNDLIAAGVNAAAGRASTEVGIQNSGTKEYGRVGANHEDKRAKIEDRNENQQVKIIQSFELQKIRFHQQYVREKQALYERNATQAQLDLFEKVTSEKFDSLIQLRQVALNTNATKMQLAKKQDIGAEQREMRGVNRTVGEQRGDADTTMTQQGIGVLDQALRGQIRGR